MAGMVRMARALRGQRTSAAQAVAGQTPECSIASHGFSWSAGALDRYWLDPPAVAGELRGRGKRARGAPGGWVHGPAYPILAEGRAGVSQGHVSFRRASPSPVTQ